MNFGANCEYFRCEDGMFMPGTTGKNDREYFDDEDPTLREIDQDHDFADVDDDDTVEIADRRRDPLRVPH